MATDGLRAKALALLAQREHSRQELHRRLAHWLGRRSRSRHLKAKGLDDTIQQATGVEAGFGDGTERSDSGADDPSDRHDSMPQSVQIEALLEELAAQGWLSEERFIESRLHVRASQWGERRIVQELHAHGLALDDQARDALRATEYDRARELWERRYGRLAESPAEAARQMRFLAGRGFGAEVIRKVVAIPRGVEVPEHSIEDDG